MLQRAWSGNEKLWIVFWLYFILAGLLLNFFGPLLIFGLGNLMIGMIVALLVWLTWVCLSGYMIWNNSKNSSKTYFGLMAKGVYLFFVIGGLASVMISGGRILWTPTLLAQAVELSFGS